MSKSLFCKNDPEGYKDNVKKIVVQLLEAVGEDPKRDGLRDTPDRVARMYRETLSGYCEEPKITVFPNDEGYNEMILDESYFFSYCEHHMVPFFGKAFIAYIPGDKLIGLSKLTRVLTFFSRRLQVQERLTKQVADYLTDKIKPKGVAVVLHGRHLCREMRGVEKHGAVMTTSQLSGAFADDVKTRQEFMSFIQARLPSFSGL